MRILKGSDFTLTLPTFVGTDRETPTACDSTPTCTVSRYDGTALTAATVTAVSNSTGVYTAALQASTHSGQVDRLQLVATGVVSSVTQVYRFEVEVVGSHWCTIPEIRSLRGLDDTAKYPLALLEEIRDEYEDYIERILGYGFTRRYHLDTFDGDWTRDMRLSKQHARTILSVSVNGVAQTTSQYDIVKDPRFTGSGLVTSRAQFFPAPTVSTGRNNVTIGYEYGRDGLPVVLKRNLLNVLRQECQAAVSNETFSVISETFEGRTLRFSTPDPTKNRPTGVIMLDPVLWQYIDHWAIV